MSRPIRLSALLVPLAALGGFAALNSRPAAKEPPTVTGKMEPKVTDAQNRFGFDLLGRLVAEKPGENVFISPYSVATALTMTYNGAIGATKDAMARTLHISGVPLETVNRGHAALKKHLEDAGPKVEIAVANALWMQKGETFKPDFIHRNREFFGAETTTVDYGQPEAAAKAINDWTSAKTRTHIPEIVSPQDVRPPTILVLTNAVYFNGKWKTPFERKYTRDAPFTLMDGMTASVPMMVRGGTYDYLRGEGFQAVRLPYGDGRLSMLLFVPDATDGLTAFLKTLDAAHWAEWMKGLKPSEGSVTLPRFRLEYGASLVKPLADLGMGPAFAMGNGFSGISDGPLGITNVIHKTFVDVDEEGTEAAAATAVIMARGAPSGFSVRADHPFFCTIRDERTGAILFMGAIYDPKQA